MKFKIIAALLLLVIGYAFMPHGKKYIGDDLLRAVEAGNQAKVHRLLEQKIDANSHDRRDYSALYFASYRGYTAIAKDLLDHGANVNARGDTKDTPLHGAAMGGQLEVVALLLSRGAEVNAVSGDGYTPLREASNPEVIKLLIAHGAK
jgi:ankyrin repeat protein